LQLSDKNITSLPTIFGNLINLKVFYLNKNQLTSLPADTEGASHSFVSK
jgi:Leucine-rich repeat (LRR) protein